MPSCRSLSAPQPGGQMTVYPFDSVRRAILCCMDENPQNFSGFKTTKVYISHTWPMCLFSAADTQGSRLMGQPLSRTFLMAFAKGKGSGRLYFSKYMLPVVVTCPFCPSPCGQHCAPSAQECVDLQSPSYGLEREPSSAGGYHSSVEQVILFTH